MNILEYENYHEDKTHVELTFPYNTYLCSIPLDFSGVPLHWHDDMELIYIKKGCGHISVDFKVSDPAGVEAAASGAKAKPAPAVEGAR